MEAYLLENEDILILDKQNFNDVTVLDAEIALKSGRKTGNGRIDILAKYGGEYLAVVELKLNEINELTLGQLQDYLDQRDQILQIGDYWEEEVAPKWVGVLVGTSICPDLQEKLRSGYEYNGIPIAGMIIRRFRSSENEIFVVSDTYFKYGYSSKDFSTFFFQGEEYNKGRLVNAVLKYYVEQMPKITFSELKQAFPNHVQGSFGVFTNLEKAENIYERGGRIRYYIKPDEIISLRDHKIATCTQWNTDNISKFIKNAESLGFQIDLG